jgi:hypothetical protein
LNIDRMNYGRIILGAVLTAFVLLPGATQAQAVQQVAASVFSMGGATGATSTLTVSSTVGQFAAGSGNLGEGTVKHGFWAAGGGQLVQSCCGQYTDGFTGNIDCSENGRIDLVDITRLIDHLFIGNPPLCCDQDGNINGSADGLITLSDITRLIDFVYISKKPTARCL